MEKIYILFCLDLSVWYRCPCWPKGELSEITRIKNRKPGNIYMIELLEQ